MQPVLLRPGMMVKHYAWRGLSLGKMLITFMIGVMAFHVLLLSQLSDKEPSTIQYTANKGISKPLKKILIGVMTAEKYLSSRAETVLATYGRDLGENQLLFFVSQYSKSKLSNAVKLNHVDDTYPPQKKSFLMMKYMFENYYNEYEWFLRIDDDAYLNVINLLEFISHLNSSELHYIGSPGFGKAEEMGKMALRPHEVYCMGGTGVLFSRELLRQFVPHIRTCLRNLYTNHEDVEIGRCVSRYVDKQCSSAYTMKEIFHNRCEKNPYDGDLTFPAMKTAAILHPVKNTTSFYRIHYEILLRRTAWELHAASVVENSLNNVKHDEEQLFRTGGSEAETDFLRNIRIRGDKDNGASAVWDFMTDKFVSANGAENPRLAVSSEYALSSLDMSHDVISALNRNSSSKNRKIDYRRLNYAFQRVHPLSGVDYMLDILLRYRRFGDKPLDMLVRRHGYYKRRFGRPIFRAAVAYTDLNARFNDTTLISQPSFSDYRSASVHIPTIHFIVPLLGRISAFQRFLAQFKTQFLDTKENVALVVVLFDSPDVVETRKLLIALKRQYIDADVTLVARKKEPFARGVALTVGADLIDASDADPLVFFVDIDMLIERGAAARARVFARRGKSVYLPIVFSQYDPQLGCVPPRVGCSTIDTESGYWRQHGYGLAAMYRSDLRRAGGFDLDLRGWGREDVDLTEKLVKAGLEIVRVPDPHLVHAFHDIECSPDLDQRRLRMCHGSKFATFASQARLARLTMEMGIFNGSVLIDP